MNIGSHTALDSLRDFPPALREHLRSLWIESAEEYLSLLAAVEEPVIAATHWVDRPTLEGTRSVAFAHLPPPRATQLHRRAGGALGCQLKPEWLQMVAATGRVGTIRTRIPDGFSKAYPAAVRLMDRLPPVKNQGSRGTCVAFGSVALLEFLTGAERELSEQFLYWACKELDGFPGPGTWLRTAASALAKYGVCTAPAWPYNFNRMPTEGQGPPPPGAREEAVSFLMASNRSVEPTLIEHYKEVLAGDGGVTGMPVVIATLVFDSWFMSAETHRTGKITMPLPGETPGPGGHAWCVVGYVDDASVPGGGYFIVRNSWGREWAVDNPEAPGHALMPFAYVERFAVEAFTGPAKQMAAGLDENGSGATVEFAKFRRKLSARSVDIEDKWCEPGTAVLFHPQKPDAFLEDNPANLEKFRRRDCTWTDPLRRELWFPSPAGLPIETRAQLLLILAAKQAFLGALDSNLKAAEGTRSPLEFRALWRAWLHFLPPARFGTVSEVAADDLRDAFLAILYRHSGAPEDLDWNDEWNRLAASHNGLRAYLLRAGGSHALAVVAFVCPFKFSASGAPQIVDLDVALFSELQALVAKWQTQRKNLLPVHTYFGLGCQGALTSELRVQSTATTTAYVTAYTTARSFETRAAPAFVASKGLRNLVERFRPETLENRVSKIKAAVDEHRIRAADPDVPASLRRIAERLAMRQTQVLEAFLKLQEHKPEAYRLQKKNGDYQLVKPTGGHPTITKLPDSITGALVAQFLATAASAAISWFVLDPLKETIGKNAVGFLAIVIGSMVGKLVERIILEKISD